VPLTGLAFRLTPGVYYEVGLALLGVALLGYLALSRGPVGLSLASLRQGPAAARALGVEGRAAQVGLFAASAAMAGMAGALLVQLHGVADPAAYGPLLSVELFLAVLLGGEGTVIGPIVGATALVVIPRASGAIGSIAGRGPERYEPVLASALLLVALLFLGRGGIWRSIGALARRVRGGRETPETSTSGLRPPAGRPPPSSTERHSARTDGETELRAHDLSKRFDGIVALDGVSLSLTATTICALIGPNGSGKTTCLRILAGTVQPDRGSLTLDGRDVTATSNQQRVRAGIVRTLQQTRVFPELTALQHVLTGTVARRSFGGAWRTLLSTPLARREQDEEREHAREALRLVGLIEAAETAVSRLSRGDQRLLILATAIVSNPRVLLLDEPSAGMSPDESGRLAQILQDLRNRGVALLLVEHNLRLVRSVAERVTVLDAGRVIAEGSPDEIGRDPVVQRVYLGSSRM
jgi:branched-chain amino acid transport system permease protein